MTRTLAVVLCLVLAACAREPLPESQAAPENLTELAPLLDTTGFRGTVLLYDLRADHFSAIHPEGADTRRIPASTFKIVNALVALGNRDLSGGDDLFWLTGGLRVSPREQINMLVQLYRDELPFSRRSMAVVKEIMEVEGTATSVVRAKTGWAVMPDSSEVGWWVGWVERDDDVIFFASVIEGDRPGAGFGPARTEVPRAVLRRLGFLDAAG